MKDIELNCSDIKAIVAVLSGVLSELFPGFTLSYSEKKELLYESPAPVLDNTYVFNCILNLEHDGRSYCITEQKAIITEQKAIISDESYFKVRKTFLESLFAAGWSEAYSPEELQLKITLTGKDSFYDVCKDYISKVIILMSYTIV